MLTAAVAAAVISYLAASISRYRKSITLYLAELSRIESRNLLYLNNLVDLIRETMETAAVSGENPMLLVKRLKKNFSVQHSNVESLIRTLPALADVTCSGLITCLRARFPMLTENDIMFISMSALKFDQNCIDYAFGYGNVRTYYNKRHEIRKKMGIPDNILFEDYIATVIDELVLSKNNAIRTAISRRTLSPVIKLTANRSPLKKISTN